jgi:putative flippase GtrA
MHHPPPSLIKHYFSGQFLTFAFVGVLAALANWFSRAAFNIWMSFSWSVVGAYIVGMSVAFLLNDRFVFPGSDKRRHKKLRDFLIVNILFFPVVWGASILLNLALKKLGLTDHTQELAHGIAVAIPALATFLAYKFFAFKDISHGRS